jgi:hypothetical protein
LCSSGTREGSDRSTTCRPYSLCLVVATTHSLLYLFRSIEGGLVARIHNQAGRTMRERRGYRNAVASGHCRYDTWVIQGKDCPAFRTILGVWVAELGKRNQGRLAASSAARTLPSARDRLTGTLPAGRRRRIPSSTNGKKGGVERVVVACKGPVSVNHVIGRLSTLVDACRAQRACDSLDSCSFSADRAACRPEEDSLGEM